MVEEVAPGKVCAEIGVWRGDFSRVILATNPKELHLIDYWGKQDGEYSRDPTNNENLEEAYQIVYEEFSLDSRVSVIRKLSSDAVGGYDNGFFDVVYIDANHTWTGITVDIFAWWEKVKSGGYLCGHDYTKADPSYDWIEVAAVVDAWARIKGLLVHSTEDYSVGASWAILKP